MIVLVAMISVIVSNNQIVITARIVNPERMAGHGVSNGIQKKSNVIKIFLISINFNYLTLAKIQCSAKSEIFVFLETSDEFSRSHVI